MTDLLGEKNIKLANFCPGKSFQATGMKKLRSFTSRHTSSKTSKTVPPSKKTTAFSKGQERWYVRQPFLKAPQGGSVGPYDRYKWSYKWPLPQVINIP